jgi:hypothetical protein
VKKILLLLLVPLSLVCAISLRPDSAVRATGGRASTATTIDLETDHELQALSKAVAWAYATATTTTTIPPTTTTTIPPTTTTTVAPAPAPVEQPYSGDVWYDLAMCETGGKMDNPNTGNGYYGYFQFALSTWQSVGGPGYPHEHSYETQKHYAQILQQRSGWGQWPHCSKELGLR